MSVPRFRTAVLALGAAGVLVATSGAVAAATSAPGGSPSAPPSGTSWATTAQGSTPAVAKAPATSAAADDPGVTYALRRGDQLVRQGTSSTQPSVLRSAGLPLTGGIYSGFGTSLVLQSDGNLVEYETTTGAVLFNTNTNDGAKLVYQQDGNVVLYNANGVARFNTGTAGEPDGEVFSSYGNGQLIIQTGTGVVLRTFGTAVTPGPGVLVASASSPDGRYRLVVQNDGNLVAYNNVSGRPFWYTATGGGRVRLAAQLDGNLVLYSASTGRPLWFSGTSGPRAYYQLDMQNDGNIVLYLTDGRNRLRAVWASMTRG